MRTLVIAANWKLNKLPREVPTFFAELSTETWPASLVAVIFPQSALGHLVADQVQKWSSDKGTLQWGAQNIFWEATGAFTGETSIEVIKALGAGWSLIGHSERRSLFGETDKQVHRKIELAFKYGIKPLVCVGETLSEREENRTFDVIETQLQEAFHEIREPGAFAIAYEPVWAIGTGKAATSDEAQLVHKMIRKWLTTKFGAPRAENISILYGGSVKPDNALEFLKQTDVDGLLVGGASLEPHSFAALITTARSQATSVST